VSDDVREPNDEGDQGESGEGVHATVEAEVVAEDDAAPAGNDYPRLTTAAERSRAEEQERRNGLTKDERQWAMFCHLAGLAGFVVPFGGIVGPLVLWQMKREESAFIDEQGREALNFNITMAGVMVIATSVTMVTMFFFVGLLLVPLLFGLSIAWVAFAVIGALKASEGEAYRYPWSIRLVT